MSKQEQPVEKSVEKPVEKPVYVASLKLSLVFNWIQKYVDIGSRLKLQSNISFSIKEDKDLSKILQTSRDKLVKHIEEEYSTDKIEIRSNFQEKLQIKLVRRMRNRSKNEEIDVEIELLHRDGLFHGTWHLCEFSSYNFFDLMNKFREQLLKYYSKKYPDDKLLIYFPREINYLYKYRY